LVVVVLLSVASAVSAGQQSSEVQQSRVKKIAFESGWTSSANVDASHSDVEGVGVAGSGPIRASIYVRDPIDSKPRYVAEGQYPSWSRDGMRVAYCTVDGALYGQIHIVNANGKGDHRLTHLSTGACFPEWSPDGREIAIAIMNGVTSKLAIVDESGKVLRELGDGNRPHWSPDGKQIVYVLPLPRMRVGSSIWTMNADGSGVKELLEDKSDVVQADWLPNGSGILFTSARDGSAAVYTMDLEGKNVRKLGGDPMMRWYHPAMSPDGKSLIVDAVMLAQDPTRRLQVVEIDAETHRAKILALGNHFGVFWGQAEEPKAQKDAGSGH
jgi:dipeptidyl aminopeptidase/acylaminoacyl peptidase